MKYTKEYWGDVASCIGNIPEIEKLYNKNLLITGATGMLASPVVDIVSFLNREKNAGIKLIIAGRNRQRTLDRFKGVLKEEEIKFVEFDANYMYKLNVDADYIIHAASNADNGMFLKEPAETLFSNVVGVKSMLDLNVKNKGSRLLYVSSSEVYGELPEKSDYIKETDYGYVDVLSTRSCYPNGKRAAETLCSCYITEYDADVVIARPGYIYGPTIKKSDKRASAAFTFDAAAGRNIVMKSKGEQLRSYCYMLDCATALLTILLEGECGEAYNISNKDAIVSIRDVAEALAKAGGVSVVFENPSDAEKSSYNTMKNSALDASKLEALGWKGMYGLSEGIERTLKYL
ncbi:NAD-dependent epimerase/dehydratase family protein [Butyrivibrio sp. X503]|uniref:NAD-dependent epimerase/dehydratase family protein n=1 Tax=Butyrivibrio sp. X503 TaxID=2364878 RepID=UPI000EA8D43B|nr:NAD-dependent epimerase/dehydratase family protein [Butyrivibrio sp. X503]RKM56379.1 NAD-dependent epimerase/dehydratase family protein [Butyrivibrio sp. X503]